MKKKIVAIVIACVLAISVGGYFVYRYVLPNKEFSLEFSEYYQQAEDFEELKPLLNQYFGMVQAAYDRSDKQNLESFILGEDYEEAKQLLKQKNEEITDKSNNPSLTNDEQKAYGIAFGAILPFAYVEYQISSCNLLIAGSNDGFAYNPDWFEELKDYLDETYVEYAEGNGRF